jgi:hypothetical protein
VPPWKRMRQTCAAAPREARARGPAG